MNVRKLQYVSVLVAALLLVGVSSILAGEGEGKVKIGYVFTDEDGHLGVNQETFNTYEGFSLSVTDFRYLLENGIQLNADLGNVTLNNRNLRVGAFKPGLFSLSAYNNQYRRTYDADGVNFTRRNMVGANAELTPIKHIRMFGGFNYTDKHGASMSILGPVADTVMLNTDYENGSFNFGAQGFCPYGNVRVEYRRYEFFDDLLSSNDRKADQVSVSLFATHPDIRWATLSGGYVTRKDELYDSELNVKTNQFWAGTKLYLKNAIQVDYRLLLANTERNSDGLETDNMVNTISVGKTWLHQGGIRVGYENRSSDDSIDKTKSDGFLAGGWLKMNRFYVKGKVTLRNKKVDEGATLVGDEDYVRHLFSVRYTDNRWGDITGRIQGKMRENKDIDSKVDYLSLGGELNLKYERYGRLNFSYTYYIGEYNNNSDDVSYEFADHVLSATVYPVEYKKVLLSAGGTYYKSQRDKDTEKFSAHAGASYEFIPGHHVQGKYKVFTYDDLLTTDRFYTGNIVEINLIKDLKL